MSEQSSYLQKQFYGIGIFEEEIVLSDFTGPSERRFVINHEQLMQFFHTEITLRPFPGLIWMKQGGSRETYLVTLPAAERTILYRKGHSPKRKGKGKLETYKMKIPSLAVRVGIDTGSRKVDSIQMWGFAGKELKEETVLYELPFPNLGGSSLCLGSTERAPTGADVRGAAERMIFEAPFNHHNHIVGNEKLVFHDYVKKYKGRCPFRTLNQIGTGRQLLEARS